MLVTTLENFCNSLGGELWVGYGQKIARTYYGGTGIQAFVQAKLLDNDTLDLVEGVRAGTGVHMKSNPIPDKWRALAVQKHEVRLLATMAFLEIEPRGHMTRVDLTKHPGRYDRISSSIFVACPVDGRVCGVEVDAEKAVLVRDGRIWIPSAQINGTGQNVVGQN